MVVLILGIVAFSTFGLSMSMLYSLSRGSEDASLIPLTGGSPTQMATASMLQYNLLTFTRGFPAFFSFLLMSALLFRFLGGPVIWGYAQSLLPWVGAFQRAHCTSELFHGVVCYCKKGIPFGCLSFSWSRKHGGHERILGLAISEDLRQGKSLIESLAMRSWYQSWLIDYLYQASDQQPLSDSLKHLANLLESQALTRCQTSRARCPSSPVLYSRIVPAVWIHDFDDGSVEPSAVDDVTLCGSIRCQSSIFCCCRQRSMDRIAPHGFHFARKERVGSGNM